MPGLARLSRRAPPVQAIHKERPRISTSGADGTAERRRRNMGRTGKCFPDTAFVFEKHEFACPFLRLAGGYMETVSDGAHGLCLHRNRSGAGPLGPPKRQRTGECFSETRCVSEKHEFACPFLRLAGGYMEAVSDGTHAFFLYRGITAAPVLLDLARGEQENGPQIHGVCLRNTNLPAHAARLRCLILDLFRTWGKHCPFTGCGLSFALPKRRLVSRLEKRVVGCVLRCG